MKRASGIRRGEIRHRCAILAAGLLMGAVSGLTMGALSSAGTASAAHVGVPAVGTAGGIVPCPAGSPSTDTCAAMPCPTASNCGQIVASPTQNLGLGQYVYLQLSGFSPGDTAFVGFCSDPNDAPLAPQDLSTPPPPPICATSSPQYTAPHFGIPIFNTSTGSTQAGTASTSVETEEASPPGIALPGNQSNSSFYCDTTAANACDIVITDFAITAGQGDFNIDAANSIEIPLTFAGAAVCPGATQVTTESEYGIEVLTPTLAQLSCSQSSSSKAVLPVETAVGGAQAVKDLAAGNVQIAFTDDPEAPDQQASLKSGHFALIPVALTANIVGIDAEILGTGLSGTQQGILYPVNQMNLTPTMVAGEITDQSNYAASYTADDQVPCSGPSEDPSTQQCGSWPCGVLGTNTTCSLFDQLNYLPGYGNYFQSSAVLVAGQSGSTDQLFTWLCNAPLVPLNFGTNPRESQSGSQSLETGFFGESSPTSTCPAGQDQPPAFNAPPNFFTYNNPETQNIKAPSWIENEGSRDAAAFINENWAEGEYYGVGGAAALQNGAGDFVTPTATSLDAAVQVATKNADGSLTPNYSSANPDAYPMPDVIYAAVSTDQLSASQATAETTLLTQLLELTGTGGSNVGQLPAGFVPMPASLVTQAQTDIAKDIVGPPTTPAGHAGGGGGGGTSGRSGSGSTSSFNLGVLGSSALLDGTFSSSLPLFSGISPSAGSPVNSPVKAAAAPRHRTTGQLLGPALPAYALAANQGNTVVTLASLLGLIALLSGLVLTSSAVLTRIRAARAAAPVAEPGGESGEVPSAAAAPT